MPLPDVLTVRQKYGPAMEMTDQDEAERYFEDCVQHTMRTNGFSREKAEAVERANFGYFAGYYSDEVRQRVEKLFRCSHPSLNGRPTNEEAFRLGQERADRYRIPTVWDRLLK